MSVNTNACLAGKIANPGAYTAPGDIDTSTPSVEVRDINQTAPATGVGAKPACRLASEIRHVRPDNLQLHPVSQEIYGKEDIDGLIADVDEHGILEPLWVTSDNVVLAGGRRLNACKALGIDEVPVRAVLPVDDTTAVEILLASNTQRVKTNEQVAREAASRMRIEQEKARHRQVEAGRAKLPAKSPEAGDARAVVAKQMGIGPKKVDQCVAIIDTLDRLKKVGDTEAHQSIAKSLEKSVNLAANKVAVLTARNQQPRRAATVDAPEEVGNDKPEIIAQLVDDLIEGMESWTIDSLRNFRKYLIAFKADWFARDGEEEV